MQFGNVCFQLLRRHTLLPFGFKTPTYQTLQTAFPRTLLSDPFDPFVLNYYL